MFVARLIFLETRVWFTWGVFRRNIINLLFCPYFLLLFIDYLRIFPQRLKCVLVLNRRNYTFFILFDMINTFYWRVFDLMSLDLLFFDHIIFTSGACYFEILWSIRVFIHGTFLFINLILEKFLLEKYYQLSHLLTIRFQCHKMVIHLFKLNYLMLIEIFFNYYLDFSIKFIKIIPFGL